MTNYISPSFTSGEEVDELLLLVQGNETFFEDLSDGNIEANVLVRTDTPTNLNGLVFGDSGLAELVVEKNGDGDPIAIRSGTGSGAGGKVIGSRKDGFLSGNTTIPTDIFVNINSTEITLTQGTYLLEYDCLVESLTSNGFQETGFLATPEISIDSLDDDDDSIVVQRLFQQNESANHAVAMRWGKGGIGGRGTIVATTPRLTLEPSFFDITTGRCFWNVKWTIKINQETSLFLKVAKKEDPVDSSDIGVSVISKTITPII